MKAYKFLLIAIIVGISACSLDEELREDLTGDQAQDIFANASPEDIASLITGVYQNLNLPFQDQAGYWALQEHTADQAMGPTRGGDWDDGGVWRVLHSQTWSPDHPYIGNTFSGIGQIIFSATNALNFQAAMTAEEIAEIRFLRAFAVYSLADGWGQVPWREADSNLLEPSEVLSGDEAIELVISELNAILPDLPDGPVGKANKNAARTLLMRSHLNLGAFANRQSPVFDATDMGMVISIADQITGYAIADNYYDNFTPDNHVSSTENIWTLTNIGGVNGQVNGGNSIRSRWFCGLHYNQEISGWNGFTTLSAFYDSFEEGDVRRYAETPGFTDVTGINNGFLVGQQFNSAGEALDDRNGAPLIFTRDASLTEAGNDLEVTGIRVQKYVPDLVNGDNVENDAVMFRYADVLLMKAEALLRTGSDAEALAIVNEIRTKRNASELTSLNLDELLAERGRELYWESIRRTDLIRFGKFLDAWHEKPASDATRLLFPIPAGQIALNPNLTQNPGY